MNTPLDDDNANLRYAAYVLGVLDADARAEVAREVRSNEQAAIAVARWAQRLSSLSEDVPPSEPPVYVWARIQHALQLDLPAHTQEKTLRPRLLNKLRFWQWLGFGTSVLAASCLALFLAHRTPMPVQTTLPYMVSTITQSDGHVGWTATMDLQHARVVVVPVTPQALAQGRAPELWLIPAGQKPIAVGMIDGHAPTILALSRAQLAQVKTTAALAVSVEPIGGSPTGQPTGPVIAQGTIGVALESTGSAKSVTVLYVPMNGDGTS